MEKKEVRKNNLIFIEKNPHNSKGVIILPDEGESYYLNSYSIGIGNKYKEGGSNTCFTPELTLEDLKELRRVIRKVIRDESK